MSKHHPECGIYLGETLAAYAFGNDHPFGPKRHAAFENKVLNSGLENKFSTLSPVKGNEALLSLFHTQNYIKKIKSLSQTGSGFMDQGDTPAFKGMFEVVLNIAGTVSDAIDRIMNNEYSRLFIPIAGLHHARANTASGFCIINDIAIGIELLRHYYAIKRIAYIDIDAHHGDGVFYSYETDPDLIFADIHEDGRFLYPGTGSAHETGLADAKGFKLNIPVAPESDDNVFMQAWTQIENFLIRNPCDFFMLQCGADSLKNDPLTHLHFSENAHAHACARLCHLAKQQAQGRLLILGGGGYNLENIAHAWTAVATAMAE